MIFHENRLPADNFHEISCLICYFEKFANLKLPSSASYRLRFIGKTCLQALYLMRCMRNWLHTRDLMVFAGSSF